MNFENFNNRMLQRGMHVVSYICEQLPSADVPVFRGEYL